MFTKHFEIQGGKVLANKILLLLLQREEKKGKSKMFTKAEAQSGAMLRSFTKLDPPCI